jgi:hypothetical protein
MRQWRYQAIVVVAVLLAACASSGSSRQSTAGASSDLLTTAEIDATPVANAYDLVNRLRPRWLTVSGARVGSISGGSVRRQIIVVYLDGTRLGGVETLRSVTTGGLKSLRYYDATRAATVVRDSGPEQLAGAIVISSKDR